MSEIFFMVRLFCGLRCAVVATYYGVVLLARTLYCHTGDIHAARMYLLLAVVGMEYIVHIALFVVEWCSVACTDQLAGELEDRVVG